MLDQKQPSSPWRQSKWLILLEMLLVGLIFVADADHLIPFSKVPFLLILGSLSLRLRRMGWRQVGLSLYQNWTRTLLLGVGAGILLESFQLFISQPLLVKWLGRQPNLEDFREVTGNWKTALIFLGLVWPLAAFGEEMVYRGYLMNRVADLFNRGRGAWLLSLILVHAVFGLAHAYQGITGVIDEGLMGFLLGLVYLATRRNLSVPIVAHGVQDTIDILLIYFGKYPGM